jgi:AP-4 complex subunit sigma-1
MAYL